MSLQNFNFSYTVKIFFLSFAEWAIFEIKSRLYRMLRGTLSKNWVELLDKICLDYNNTPSKSIGWLKPNDITNVYDSVKVRKAKLAHNILPYSEPNFRDQQKNQQEFEKSSDIKKGSYVYLDFKEELFGKSFDVQVVNKKHTSCIPCKMFKILCCTFKILGFSST